MPQTRRDLIWQKAPTVRVKEGVAFKELKYFEAYSAGGNYVYVAVNGFARICSTTGGHDVVKMLTPYGIIILDDDRISFVVCSVLSASSLLAAARTI